MQKAAHHEQRDGTRIFRSQHHGYQGLSGNGVLAPASVCTYYEALSCQNFEALHAVVCA